MQTYETRPDQPGTNETASSPTLPGLGSPFTEMEELELAAELLEATDDQELDQFLGRLLRRAATAVGRSLSGQLGRPLGGVLKGAIKRAMPSLGSGPDSFAVPGTAASSGSHLADGAAEVLGLELEGLSHEDQEFEAAKQLVRLSGAAASNAATASPGLPAAVTASRAVAQAARQHAPGLLQPAPRPTPGGCHCHQTAGRWERRGQDIILHGL